MSEPGPTHHPPGLADFAGHWRLERQIFDRLGPSGTFRGTARFIPEGQGLAYLEQGHLQLGDGPALAAERRYLWRAEGECIAVEFADGRPFHRFDPAQTLVRARHECDPDLYLVHYAFGAWPRWQVEWQVKGPRKHYRMVTDYVPGADIGSGQANGGQ